MQIFYFLNAIVMVAASSWNMTSLSGELNKIFDSSRNISTVTESSEESYSSGIYSNPPAWNKPPQRNKNTGLSSRNKWSGPSMETIMEEGE